MENNYKKVLDIEIAPDVKPKTKQPSTPSITPNKRKELTPNKWPEETPGPKPKA